MWNICACIEWKTNKIWLNYERPTFIESILVGKNYLVISHIMNEKKKMIVGM